MVDFVLDKVLYPAPDSSYTEGTFPGFLLNISAGMALPRMPALLSSPRDCQTGEMKHADFAILSIHGNAMDVGHLHAECQMFADEYCCHVLAPEFPGYGVYTHAKPTEEGIDQAAEVGLRFITEHLKCPPERTILLGRSIGTGIVSRLAAKWARTPEKHSLAGVVLISPYISIPEIVRDHAPSCIASWIRHRWRPEDDLEKSEAPILFLHGHKDDLIPPRHSKTLWEQLKNADSAPQRRGAVLATDLLHKGVRKGGACWLRISSEADHNVWDYNQDLVEPIRAFVFSVQQTWKHTESPIKEMNTRGFLYPELRRQRDGAKASCTLCA